MNHSKAHFPEVRKKEFSRTLILYYHFDGLSTRRDLIFNAKKKKEISEAA